MLEHIDDRCPKKLKVVLAKACYLLSEHCGNIALATIKRIWNYALFAHFGISGLFSFFCCFCLPCDCDILRKNGVDTSCKVELYRTPYNAAWIVTCTHYCTECSYVKVVLTDVITSLTLYVSRSFLSASL